MKALQIVQTDHSAFVEIEKPVAGEEEILLEVAYVGLCGSDLNTFKGLNPLVQLPRVPGHEISATVVGMGKNVPDHYQLGMSVVAVPYTSCGACSSCRKGRVNACRYNKTLGVQQEGGLQPYVTLPWQKVLPVEGLSLEEITLIEPLSVGFHAIERADVSSGDKVAVFGAGMIGLGAIMAAVAKGADVIVIDIYKHKLELAKKIGASFVIDGSSENVQEVIGTLTKDEGVDLAVEAVGIPLTFVQSVEVAAFAGQVVYIGYAKEAVSYRTELFNLKELNIMGSRNATDEDMKRVIEYLKTSDVPVKDFITKIFPFEQAEQALSYWDQNRSSVVKVLVKI